MLPSFLLKNGDSGRWRHKIKEGLLKSVLSPSEAAEKRQNQVAGVSEKKAVLADR